ncbi:hypothetical protein [Brevibacillus reuszeri]|uniref:hypothetical protein n=1 Tax=Brevibacillus reuszeri TaxID=54915 RepID=UPI001F3B1777|nr:hypothetical protein [Brevibacillus reuszeri]
MGGAVGGGVVGGGGGVVGGSAGRVSCSDSIRTSSFSSGSIGLRSICSGTSGPSSVIGRSFT